MMNFHKLNVQVIFITGMAVAAFFMASDHLKLPIDEPILVILLLRPLMLFQTSLVLATGVVISMIFSMTRYENVRLFQTSSYLLMNEFRVADNNTSPALNSSMTDDCMRDPQEEGHRAKTKTCRKRVVPPTPPTESNLEAINNNGLINQESINIVEPLYDITAMEATQCTGELYHAPPETSFDQPSEPNYVNCPWEEGDVLLSRYQPSNEVTWGGVYGVTYFDNYSSFFSSPLDNYGMDLGNHLYLQLDAGSPLSST